jgi:hypothetical protein
LEHFKLCPSDQAFFVNSAMSLEKAPGTSAGFSGDPAQKFLKLPKTLD